MSGAQIVAEQESATRPTSRIDSESWDGVAQVGRSRQTSRGAHLDPRVLIRALLRLEPSCTGPVESRSREPGWLS